MTNDTSPPEWEVTLHFNIDSLRALHYHLEYAIKMWPGSPARPAEEQEYLSHLKMSVFTAMMDYNYHYLKTTE